MLESLDKLGSNMKNDMKVLRKVKMSETTRWGRGLLLGDPPIGCLNVRVSVCGGQRSRSITLNSQ